MTSTFSTMLRRCTIALFALVLAFVATYVPQNYVMMAKVAKAQQAVTVVGPSLALQAKETAESTKATVESTAQTFLQGVIAKVTSISWWYDSVIKPMGWALAKAIISSIQRDVVRWINSGFKGSPAFIQDLEGFMLDVADNAAGNFIQEVGGPLSIICSPFRLDIQIALGVAYNRSRGKLNRCTLTGALANIEQFIDGNFSQGGWDAWLNIVHNPNTYTPYGAGLEASLQLDARIVNAQGQQLTLSGWSGGFLNSKVCEPASSPTGSGGASSSAPSQGKQAAEQNCKVVTPGQVIASQLNDTLQLGNDSLVTADQINEVIGAFMSQIVTQTLSGAKGLLGMGGNAQYKNPSFNIDQYEAGMEATIDTTQARYFMTESLKAADAYIAAAKSVIDRYRASTAPTDEIRDKAKAAYDEAVAQLPVLEAKRITLVNAIAKLDAAQSITDKQAAMIDFNSMINSVDTEGTVAEKKIRWDAALDGLVPRDDTTFDDRTVSEALAREKSLLTLTSKVISTYRGIRNPSAAEIKIYDEVVDTRDIVQSNIIALQDIQTDYKRGGESRAEAKEAFVALKTTLHSEQAVQKFSEAWSSLYKAEDLF